MLNIKVEKPKVKYEGVLILHPDSTEEEQKKVFTKNAQIVKDYNGELAHVDTWGKRPLGNPVKNIRKGIYFHYYFEADGKVISEIERTYRINDKVMRFMHSKLDADVGMPKHIETFKEIINSSNARLSEMEEKAKKKAAAMRQKR